MNPEYVRIKCPLCGVSWPYLAPELSCTCPPRAWRRMCIFEIPLPGVREIGEHIRKMLTVPKPKQYGYCFQGRVLGPSGRFGGRPGP